MMLVDFQVMSHQEFITNKIINRVRLLGKFSEPKKSKGVVIDHSSRCSIIITIAYTK
jgi:hypothetical protein